MNKSAPTTRHPLLVLAWSFGLFILAHCTQYIYMFIVSHFGGVSMLTLLRGELSGPRILLVQGLIALILGLPVTFLAVKYLWRRKREWMGAVFNYRLLGYGIILGLVLPVVILLLISIPASVNLVGGPSRFLFYEIIFILVGNLGYIIFVSVLEEYIFRGMAMREWSERWGWPIAALLSGVYFGVAHLIAILPHISFWYFIKSALMISVASLLFAAMYYRTRSLWLPIGFHLGWNLCMKAIMGTITSGNNNVYGLFETLVNGPELWTGGAFGIELSIITLVVYLILTLLVIKIPIKK